MAGSKRVKLLLLENVENLGIVGDVVEVKPGYARNYLLPHLLATVPTPTAVKRVEARRAEVERELAELRRQQETVFEKLEGYELTLQRSANEQGVLYGGVSQHDIAEALREAGLDISDRYVRIGEQIKRLDTYHIPMQLAADLKTEITLHVVSGKPVTEDGEETIDEEEAQRQAEIDAFYSE